MASYVAGIHEALMNETSTNSSTTTNDSVVVKAVVLVCEGQTVTAKSNSSTYLRYNEGTTASIPNITSVFEGMF